MIEKKFFDFLADELNVPVFMEVPPTPPATYVVLQKTGDSESNRLRTATIAIQSVAPSLYEAASLNETVIDALHDASIADVFRIELNSAYNFTNTNTKERRYQAVFDITYKG